MRFLFGNDSYEYFIGFKAILGWFGVDAVRCQFLNFFNTVAGIKKVDIN